MSPKIDAQSKEESSHQIWQRFMGGSDGRHKGYMPRVMCAARKGGIQYSYH